MLYTQGLITCLSHDLHVASYANFQTQLYSVQPYLFSGIGQSLKNQYGNKTNCLLTLLVLVWN